MSYFLDLFTPETWTAFRAHGCEISGFRERQRKVAQERLGPGDIFLCYLVKLSRWCGALQITSKAFLDGSPIFADPDPFVVRFCVKPLIILEPERSLPMLNRQLWEQLHITREIPFGVKGWGIPFRGSLREITREDGDLLLSRLSEQNDRQHIFEFSDRDQRQLGRKSTVRALNREVVVQIPDEEETTEEVAVRVEEPRTEARESIQVQAKIARVGAEMGFRIWVPPQDRARVKDCLEADHHAALLDKLPLNYDENTNRTIEQIDVIWLKNRSLVRAFEVEHSTAIYSGLLRMADLLVLQPNMEIRLHIVAPDEKREKVKSEIIRPVFSLLDQGPLYEKCTYISYGAIQSLAEMQHLSHMNDSIIEEYEEFAEEG
jgi:hypothetical protein